MLNSLIGFTSKGRGADGQAVEDGSVYEGHLIEMLFGPVLKGEPKGYEGCFPLR